MRKHEPVYYDEASKCRGITLHEDIMSLSKAPGRFCSGDGSRPDSPPRSLYD